MSASEQNLCCELSWNLTNAAFLAALTYHTNADHPTILFILDEQQLLSIAVHRVPQETAMEPPRKAMMASSTLVVWLLVVHSCKQSLALDLFVQLPIEFVQAHARSWMHVHAGLQVPCALGADDCWVLDRHRYRFCFKTARCRTACAADRFVDGRCKHGFPYLLPLCECLRPQCAAAGPTSHSHAVRVCHRSIPIPA